MSIFVKIVSANEEVLAVTADSVVLPTVNGEIEILSGHLPILTILTAGVISVKTAGKSESIAVSEGFVRVHSDHVDVLVEEAVDVKTVDLEAIDRGIEMAKDAIQKAREKQLPDNEIKELEAKLQYQFAKKLMAKS